MRFARLTTLLILVGGIGGFAACSGAPRQKPIKTSPIAEGAGTTQGARQYLLGRWSLLSFEVTRPGREPLAMKGSGMLVFDEFGNLKMELRTDGPTGDLLAEAGIPNDRGVVMQEGRVAVDMQNHTLTYVLQGGAPLGVSAGPLASNRPRYWQVEGNILTLTTKDDKGGPLSVGRWQKAQIP